MILHPDLRLCLGILEELGYSIIITSAQRDISEHIEIYKDQARKNNKKFNIDDIPLKSRHLPKHGEIHLRAVDFKAYRKVDGKLEKPTIIKEKILEIQKRHKLGFLGIGTDLSKCVFTHIDTDRSKNTFWEY